MNPMWHRVFELGIRPDTFVQLFSANKHYSDKINDILKLFKGTKQDCEICVDWLNSFFPGVIKFKYEFSKEKVELLIANKKLETNLFINHPTSSCIWIYCQTTLTLAKKG